MNRTKKNAFLYLTVFVLIFSMLLPTAVSAASLLDPKGRNGEHVIVNVGRDEKSYNLTWHSEDTGAQQVQWAKASEVKDGNMPADCFASTAKKRSGAYRGVITDLKSDTDYLYRVGSDDAGWSKLYTLSTGSFGDNSFSFIAAGDPQIDSKYDTHNWDITLNHVRNWFGDDIEFMLTLGDHVNYCYDRSEYEEFIKPDVLRGLPIMGVLGNHDDGDTLYSEYFTYTDVYPQSLTEAGDQGGNYWVAHDGVLFINLNMNNDDIDLHVPYMENVIAEYTATYGEPLWTIVSFHQSFYAGGESYSSSWRRLREAYGIKFSEMGVDAVLAGHDHIYTRTYMINGATIIDDPDLYTPVGDDPYGSYTLKGEGDICYITQNPAAGFSFDEMNDSELGYDAFLKQEEIPYVTKVDVTPESLTFTVHRVTPTSDVNDIADFFVISRDTEKDTAAPQLTVPEEVYYYAGEDVDLLYNTRAYDINDGNLTDKIKVSGSLDPTRESVITYSVTDAQGNKAEKKARFIPYIVDGQVNGDNVWTYLEDGTLDDSYVNGAHEWAQADFDTTGWKEAKGPFGAINGELGDHHGIIPETLLGQYYPVGSDEEGYNVPNFFFRSNFDVKDPSNVDRIVLEMTIDDGASIFINGVELTTVGTMLREGFYTGYCNGSHKGIYSENGAYYNIVIEDPEVISALNLKESSNIIAVEIYQEGLYSDDILFALHEMTFSHKAVAKTLPFTDVKSAHWFYDSIYNAYNKGLFVGTSEDKFSPNGTITRAMAWAVLARIAGSSANKGEKLWYSEYQAWAMESGVSDGTYPNQNVTREQLVSMLYRMQSSPKANASFDSFSDAAKVSPWAKDAMAWAVETELIVGRGDKLAPRDGVTRAEACVLLLKYLELK